MKISQFFSQTLTYGLGEVLNKFFGFMLIPLFTRYLTPEDYGVNSLLALLIYFIQPMTLLGLGTSSTICYFDSKDPKDKSATIWTCFLTLLISSLIPLAVISLFSTSLSVFLFKSEEFSTLIVLTMLTCLMINVTSPFIWVLKFENRSTRFVLLSALSVLTTLSLNILFIVVLGQGIQGWILAGSLSALVSLGLFAIGSLSLIPRFSFSIKIFRQLLKLGAPMILSLVFIVVMQHCNRFLLNEISGLKEVGLYTVGYNFGMIINLFVTAVCFAWPPYFMRFSDDPKKGEESFSEIFNVYVICLGSIVFFLFLFSKPVLQFMTAPEFHSAFSIVGLIALANLFYGAFHLLLPGVYFAKKVVLSLIPQCIASFICIVSALLLIPFSGMIGAAISLLMANFTLCVAQYFVNHFCGFFQPNYDWMKISLYSALFFILIAVDTLIGHPLSKLIVIPVYLIGLWGLMGRRVKHLMRWQTA